MLVTTDDVIAAWLSPSRQLSIRVKMNDVTYGSEDITSLSFDSGSISGETYQIGSTYMNSIQIIFPSLIETVKEDMELLPELGVLVNGIYEYTKLGHFFIDEFERNRNNNTTTIKATDKMRFMEGPYESKLSYPRAYKEVALEIANLSGVEVNQNSFASLGIGAINKPVDYTFRQAIGLIAQFEGGFASFNRNGELEIRRLAPTTFEINPESYMLKGFTKNEVSYRIGGISVKTGEEETDVIRVGSTNGSQVQLENRVMTQQLLNQTWELVKDLNYFPYELKWRGCPPLEAGDWIYVTANDGTKYSVPNLSYSVTFNGGMSAESKATTSSSSQATYKYRGPLNQRIDYLDSILSSNNWNSNYYDSTEPPNPKEGDVWFKPNGKDTEIWVYKNVDGVLDWVMEITSAGDPELLAAIEKAKDEAEKAQNAASNAVDKANEAVAKVDSMDKAVNTALEQSASAIDQAQQAIKDANNLLTTVTDVQGTVTNISTVVDEINNQLAVKVSQTDFDKLKGTVDTQAVQISANATEIALKASQSSVNTITGNVESIQSELKTQAGSITAINTKVEGNTTQIGTIQSSYNGLSSTIANVQNDINNLDSRNWLKGTIQKRSLIGNNTSNQGMYPYNFVFGALNNIPAKLGDPIVIAYDWEVSGDNLAGTFFPQFGNTPYNIPNREVVTITSSNKKGSSSFITSIPSAWLASTAVAVSIGFRADNLQGTLEISNLRFLISTKDTGWSPAPEDLATVNEMSNITQTVKDIQLTVADKVSQSQFTILSDQVTSVVKDIGDITNRFPDYNFKKQTPKPVMQDSNVTAVYDDNGIVLTNNGTDIRRAYWSLAGMAIGKSYNIKMYANVGTASINKEIEVGFSGGENFKFSIPAANTPTWISGTARASGNGSAVSFWIPAGVAIRLRELYVYEANTNITSSQITQLSDSINFRVEKNDVVNQINISTEGVLIAGKKIQITGETYIANAVIKTANIADLAITNTKIADATISSAKIINLDASKVTAGSLVGVNIKSASNGSLFEVQGNNLKMTKSNGDNLIMDTSGIYWKNTSGDVLFQTSNKLTTSDIFGTSEFNVYLAAFNETRSVTYASALIGSGGVNDYTYVNHRAAGLYAGFVEVNTGAGSNPTNVYIRPLTAENEVRITASGGTSSYARLRAGRLYANSLSINGATNAVQLYLQTSDEVRVKAGGEDSEAAAYRAIRASAFNTSSLAEYKMNIRPFAKNALDLIKDSTVYEYNLISDPLVNEIGLVIGNGYNITDYVVNGDGVSQYRMNSLSWKAIQELDKKTTDEIEQLKTKIEILENQIRVLQAA
ncbi:hypothetical protein [Enterococcus casseliflavus]|uniref:hypothetical protein n=1 Tax=Enterococcus casseliflavus TaxID=37734 RepID=UPI003D141430